MAGNGTPGFAGDGGPAVSARLQAPQGIALGPDGSLYIADAGNHRIRRVGPDGLIRTVAGSGGVGATAEGSLATTTPVGTPFGVTVGADGSIYLTNNHAVYRVGSEGIITRVAGSGIFGFSGDGSPATNAQLHRAAGVALALDGSLYVTDQDNNRIRRVAPSLPGLDRTDFLVADEDGESVHQFDRRGRHLRTLDARTKAALQTFSYENGLLSRITDVAGVLTAFIGPYGQRTEVSQSGPVSPLTALTNPAGETHRLSYAPGGLLTRFETPRGHASTFSYDSLGRLERDQNAAGGSQNLSRTDLPTGTGLSRGYEATRVTGENRSARYRIETLPTGTRRSHNTAYDGTQTTRLENPDGSSEVTRPDGTALHWQEAPDPRFGMQAPITSDLRIVTGGITAQRGHHRPARPSPPSAAISAMRCWPTPTTR